VRENLLRKETPIEEFLKERGSSGITKGGFSSVESI
jgi:hypothetical protein